MPQFNDNPDPDQNQCSNGIRKKHKELVKNFIWITNINFFKFWSCSYKQPDNQWKSKNSF